jgi:hypothetical protein
VPFSRSAVAQGPITLPRCRYLFEDGTYDVMKAMNLRKDPDLAGEKKKQMQEMLG